MIAPNGIRLGIRKLMGPAPVRGMFSFFLSVWVTLIIYTQED